MLAGRQQKARLDVSAVLDMKDMTELLPNVQPYSSHTGRFWIDFSIIAIKTMIYSSSASTAALT